jgi:hypothetical protein
VEFIRACLVSRSRKGVKNTARECIVDGAGATRSRSTPGRRRCPQKSRSTLLAIGRSDPAFPWRSKIGVTGSRLGDQ